VGGVANPPIEPYETGLLDTGDGNLVYWETCCNPDGPPALVVHGGPGAGCSVGMRRSVDPERHRVILFDQRNCGRSRPHASRPDIDLASNTTANLIADIERLRAHLDVDRWLVFGGSWGSTLALAYAEAHPDRVGEIVLFGVTTGRHTEFDWTFRGGLARFFPAEWERLRTALPPAARDGDVGEAYRRLLNDPDPTVCRRAADVWCQWESATLAWPPTEGLSDRFRDPDYALAFARIVTHYVQHNAWLEDGFLLRGAGALASIPGILVNGRFDFQAPISNAWELMRVWPRAELVVVDEAGHAPTASVHRELVRATDYFASFQSSPTPTSTASGGSSG
jgi:proline iminopeptidase